MNSCCRIGTSGWIYRHWHGVFYPETLAQEHWYPYYAAHFDTVEINYSFYRLPSEAAFDRWHAQAPAGFLYSVKANRYLTHLKRLKDVEVPLERFLSRVRRLGDKLGAILWQLPPRWPADPARLRSFAALLPLELHHVFEFRDPSWFTPAVYDVLREFDLGFCIFHMPGITCPLWVTGQVIYLRFHGTAAEYCGRYDEQGLAPWAGRIQEWLADGHIVYAYFNNDTWGHAIQDALLLRRLVGQK
jgi:uncharacterized protein YecE (DUF72 family)